MSDGENIRTAVLGGGCFWCTEAVFQDLQGVRSVVPGYSGGTVPNPTYQQVCTETTGHAEVIEVRFDPREISYRDLLGVFFATHDPTSLDRQGNDVGNQYRSVIFYVDDEQRREAEQAVAELEQAGVYDAPVVTSVEPLVTFYEAEAYHRNFFRNNPQQPYCTAVIAPKVARFRKSYLDRLRG